MADQVTIDTGMVQRMVKDARFVRLLPAIRTLQTQSGQQAKKAGCSSCSRKARPTFTNDQLWTAVRNTLGQVKASPDIKQQLKSLLAAKQLRFKYKTPAGTKLVVEIL